MEPDRPAVPAEQEALDKPWRLWASIAIASFVLVSLGLGFVLLPETQGSGFNPLAAICRAIGISGYVPPAATPDAAATPASQVAWTSSTRALIANASIERGATLATDLCAACHGEDGIGVDPSFPNLAHQWAAASFKQLQDYKSGSRQGGQAEVMAPLARELDEQQMADVAAYYASREPRDRVEAESAVRLSIVSLATIGDPARGLAPCDACHGRSRDGPQESPVLLGQSRPYLEEQLRLFASEQRDNDLFARMRTIAAQLTPEELRGLAIYYGGNPVLR